jgi:Rnl2 family RNA ligase
MSFEKYPEIENTYREKEINETFELLEREKLNNLVQWVVTEKTHGSNLSFIVNGEVIKVAKRSGIFNPQEENFYNAHLILEKYKEDFYKIFDYIKNELYPQVKEIQIFGELFGGEFFGKKEGKRVQKGVEYIPFNDFLVFDIRIELENDSFFLPFKEVVNIFENVSINLKLVPILYIGTFKECLQYPNEFPTKIPEMYGLENKEDNICEGVVIKPYNMEIYNKYGRRVIFKNKNEKFAEKQKASKQKKEINLTEEDNKNIENFLQYVNENRLNAVLSKGEVEISFKNFGKIAELFMKDCIKDYNKENEIRYNDFDKKVKKIINKKVSEIIRNYLKRR